MHPDTARGHRGARARTARAAGPGAIPGALPARMVRDAARMAASRWRRDGGNGAASPLADAWRWQQQQRRMHPLRVRAGNIEVGLEHKRCMLGPSVVVCVLCCGQRGGGNGETSTPANAGRRRQQRKPSWHRCLRISATVRHGMRVAGRCSRRHRSQRHPVLDAMQRSPCGCGRPCRGAANQRRQADKHGWAQLFPVASALGPS